MKLNNKGHKAKGQSESPALGQMDWKHAKGHNKRRQRMKDKATRLADPPRDHRALAIYKLPLFTLCLVILPVSSSVLSLSFSLALPTLLPA